VPLHDFATA